MIIDLLKLFVLAALVGLSGAVQADTGEANAARQVERNAAPFTQAPPSAGPELETLMDQLFPQGDSEQEQLRHTRADFPGSPERPALFEVLAATRKSNPMVQERCRREAADKAVSHLARSKGLSREEATHLAHQHVEAMQRMAANKPVSYAAYLQHIVECKGFCRPLVAHMVNCHVLAVASHERGIVLFDYDSAEVKERYERTLLAEVGARLASDSGLEVLLVGRASRTGGLRYNRLLSGRRALAVKDILLQKDVEPNRIHLIWLGWEQPHINEWIAEQYGLQREYRLGQRQINQSVMLVLYESSPAASVAAR